MVLTYNEPELLALLIQVASSHVRHRYYEHTIAHAKWCEMIMTGNDQDDLLVKYKRRETEEQKSQRIRVTNSRTQYVSTKVYNLFSEVHRSDRLVNNVSYSEEGQESQVLSENMQKFHVEQDLESYLDEIYRRYNFYDPNTFLIIEFINEDPVNERPRAYPVIANSSEVVHYDYFHGILQYLMTMKTYEVPSRAKGREVEEIRWYTLYAKGYAYILIDIPPDADYLPPDGYELENHEVKGDEKDHTFALQRFETGTGQVMATRLGYKKDERTKWETYVSPMFDAENVLTDLVWKKSEYDLAHALHGFYQKFIYVDDCPTCNGSGQVTHDQTGGDMVCPSCEGSGTDTHTSTQDIIEVIRVNSKEEHIPLSEMVHYEMIPMDLIRQQKEDVKDLEKDVFNNIFGSNVLERSEIAQTATAHNYDWRAVNNTLLPYADGYVGVFRQVVRAIADIRQVGQGLVIEYAFPQSFNLESIEYLLTQRSTAVQADAPYAVRSAIDKSIIAKQRRDDPYGIQFYEATEQVRPFKDKSLQERTMLLTLLDPLDPLRVGYTYFETIMNRIDVEYPTYALLSKENRLAIYNEAVALQIATLSGAEPTQLFGMTAPENDDDETEVQQGA